MVSVRRRIGASGKGGWLRRAAAGLVLLPALFLALDALFPLPLPEGQTGFSRVVLDREGRPLRAFPDAEGVWRYPVTPEQVSPRYLEALIGYEDRFFRYHPGINPFSLLRAVAQWIGHGEIVSGGSTLTMQVARLLDPHPRSIPGKLRQMFRALQLEWHLDKGAILTLYLNRAPFGGTLEGVQAASFGYLGKPAAELSHAEAALLAVLPQAPTRIRPDLDPERARAARDKVLDRLAGFGVWDAATVRQAKAEPVPEGLRARPLVAPLLARRLLPQVPPGGARRTTLDGNLQRVLEGRMAALAGRLPERTSAAILVLENADLAVRAYLGSVDFGDAQRYGHVDMVQALRSPGSTLKPFLYGFALEAGLIHSESLLSDAPGEFGDYRPGNFTGGFAGPVSAADALRRSLNIPAVQLLEALGPRTFSGRLRQGGIPVQLPADAEPNLSLILGGGGSSLERLTAGFAALARDGRSGLPRFFPEDAAADRYLMDGAAAWVVRRTLAAQPRPGLTVAPADGGGIAWKTGTSYGYRDAWAVGVGTRYSVGVWVGRPDGTPLPGAYGAVTAAPILFSVFDLLGDRGQPAPLRPPRVELREICWPLGTEARPGVPCPRRHTAWVLDGTVPPTLPDRQGRRPGVMEYRVDVASGLRLPPGCGEGEPRQAVLWPAELAPWLTPAEREATRLPPPDPACSGGPAGPLSIAGVSDGAVLRPAGAAGAPPQLALSAIGARGSVWWLVDGLPVFGGGPAQGFVHRFDRAGRYRITAVDAAGGSATVTVRVEL